MTKADDDNQEDEGSAALTSKKVSSSTCKIFVSLEKKNSNMNIPLYVFVRNNKIMFAHNHSPDFGKTIAAKKNGPPRMAFSHLLF